MSGELDRIAAALDADGWRPIVDRELDLVRCECPHCRAGERDPLRLYRPLVVAPRNATNRIRCESCGGGHG